MNVLKWILVCLVWSGISHAQGREPVDVLLVLATDVSGSVSDDGPASEYLLQKKGMAQALRDPDVAYMLERCNGEGLGLTYIEWSGGRETPQIRQRVEWRRLRDREDLAAFADELDQIHERSSEGGTDVVSAIRYSVELANHAPFRAHRKIISLSSDGVQNISPGLAGRDRPDAEYLTQSLEDARNLALAQGMIIDALVLTTDPFVDTGGHSLTDYYRAHVAGGVGHIVVPVGRFQDYAKGLKRKLLRELDNCSS